MYFSEHMLEKSENKESRVNQKRNGLLLGMF